MDPGDRLSDINITSLIPNHQIHLQTGFWYLTRELVIFTVSIFSLISDAFIIFAVYRCKSLTIPGHLYLLLLAATDGLVLLLWPYADVLSMRLLSGRLDFALSICLSLQWHHALRLLHVFLSLALLSDWTIRQWLPARYVQVYFDGYRLVQVLVYLLLIGNIFLASMYCIFDWKNVHHSALPYMVIVTVLVVMVLQVLAWWLRRKPDYALTLPTIYAIAMVPCLVIHYSLYLLEEVEFLHQLLYGLGELVVRANSIANVWVLTRHEMEYGELLQEFVRCKIKRERDPEVVRSD